MGFVKRHAFSGDHRISFAENEVEALAERKQGLMVGELNAEKTDTPIATPSVVSPVRNGSRHKGLRMRAVNRSKIF